MGSLEAGGADGADAHRLPQPLDGFLVPTLGQENLAQVEHRGHFAGDGFEGGEEGRDGLVVVLPLSGVDPEVQKAGGDYRVQRGPIIGVLRSLALTRFACRPGRFRGGLGFHFVGDGFSAMSEHEKPGTSG